jgi:hypothetical protein
VQCGLFGCRRLTGTAAAADQTYPRRTNLGVSHLVCPPPVEEVPPTRVNFAASSPTTRPAWFIDGAPFDLDALLAYASAPDIGRTRRLNLACAEMGNATDLTAFMIGSAADPAAPGPLRDAAFTNWNLDGDRSYGAKTWQGKVDLPEDETQPGSVSDEKQL